MTRPIAAAELAELTGRSRSKVSESLSSLPTTPGPRGTRLYDSVEALRLLFGGAGLLNPQQQRARLDKARADMAELELQQRAGELIAVSDVKAVWTEEVQRVKNKLLHLPARIAPTIIGVDELRAVERTLREAIIEALSELEKDE